MRALAIVMFLCGIAVAAPKYGHTPSASKDPAMVAAERKWKVAAASRGPAQSDLWEDAAAAFIAVAEAGTLPRPELALAARSALAAFKNAMHVDPGIRQRGPATRAPHHDRAPEPQLLTPRDERIVQLLDVATRFETDPDELASLAFMRANIYRRHDQLEKAIPIFLDLVANHGKHEVAEYSANLVLDAYNRLQRYEDLVAFATKLRGNKAFLANRDELAQTVRKIFEQGQRLLARNASNRARETGDRSFYERCAEAYISLLDPTEPQKTDDDSLYNAMTCYSHAGSIDRAIATLRRLTSGFPHSQLTKRANVHAISMLSSIGRFDEAATVGERWLRKNALERDAPDIFESTIQWRVATGSLDHAIRIFDDFAPRVKSDPLLAERASIVAVVLAAFALDDARTRPGAEAGRRRADALRLLSRRPSLARSIHTDAASRIEIARVFAAAACPIPLVDELCARVREPALLATARRELTRVANPNDAATLLLADLALEAILMRNAPTANLGADYQHLTSSADAEVRVAAHARLAALARHAKNEKERATQLAACIAEAYASRTGDTWRAICERDLGQGHQVPTPRAPALFVLEPPLRPSPAPNLGSRAEEIDLFGFD